MLRLVVFVMLLIPFIVLACLFMIFAGQEWGKMPLPDDEQRLLQICVLPCWGGLTPGQTNFTEVGEILTAQFAPMNPYPSLTNSVISFGIDTPRQHIGGLVYYNRGRVGDMLLTIKLPFSVLMDALGTPDCVDQPLMRTRTLIVYWARGTAFIKTLLVTDERGRLTMDMQAQDLHIGSAEIPCAGRIPWRGFAPIWRYRIPA